MTAPEQTPYEALGGEVAVRALVDRFYDRMDSLAEARPIREMHPPNMAMSREKLFLFLSGWLGGPSLYIKRFGHPRLRARHMPFAIGDAEAEQWMACMDHALADVPNAELRTFLSDAFRRTALHMRNQGAMPVVG